MPNIRYVGKADVRELSAADLKLAGVEGFSKTSFSRHAQVEVSDEVADALVENKSGLFNNFERVSEAEAPEEKKVEKKGEDSGDGPTDTGHTATTDTPGTRRGARSSS